MINKNILLNNKASLQSAPFNHLVIDGFYEADFASQLSKEFPSYDDDRWHVYKNSIEDKKTINSWNFFDSLTYKAFLELSSISFTQQLADFFATDLIPDIGLHGGGLHIHSTGGNLNPHLDYSIHPKANMQRKINIIVYLGDDLKPGYGGHLGLWTHDKTSNQPGDLVVEVEPKFNRAIIFDTTQNSWHGMSQKFIAPEGVSRKSHAMYYLTTPNADVPDRMKALFAPRSDQVGDLDVLNQIALRSHLSTASQIYTAKK